MTAGRFSTDVYAQRLQSAAAAAADAGLAGLVVTPGYDLRYLIGSRAQTFERLTALVLPVSGEPTIVVPRMELASLKESAATELGLPVRDWVDGDDPYRIVGDTLGGGSVAVAVTDSMPALHLLPLAEVLGVVPVLATDVLRRCGWSRTAPRSKRCARQVPPSTACMPGCRNFWCRAGPRPT